MGQTVSFAITGAQESFQMIIPGVDQPLTNYASCDEPIAIPLQNAADARPEIRAAVLAPIETHLAQLERKRMEGECVGDSGSGKPLDAAMRRSRPMRAIVVAEAE
jgi:hypothetical protein